MTKGQRDVFSIMAFKAFCCKFKAIYKFFMDFHKDYHLNEGDEE